MLHVVQGRTLTLTLPPTLLLSFSFSLVTLQHALVSNESCCATASPAVADDDGDQDDDDVDDHHSDDNDGR